MTPSRAAHRAAAGEAGRGAAQRQLVGHATGFAEGGDPLELYLKGLADWVRRAGYSVDGKKKVCLWCQRPGGLKTGSLPYVGALLYCPACEPMYQTCKERRIRVECDENEPETKVHLRDGWDASACGVGSRTTDIMSKVTCKRCRAWYATNSLPRSVFDFLKGGGK